MGSGRMALDFRTWEDMLLSIATYDKRASAPKSDPPTPTRKKQKEPSKTLIHVVSDILLNCFVGAVARIWRQEAVAGQ